VFPPFARLKLLVEPTQTPPTAYLVPAVRVTELASGIVFIAPPDVKVVATLALVASTDVDAVEPQA
jgi:hypothetical protein